MPKFETTSDVWSRQASNNALVVYASHIGSFVYVNILRYVLCLAAFLLCVALLPVLLPISFVFWIHGQIMTYLIEKRSNGNMTAVPGNEAVWLQDSPTNRAIVNGVLQLKGKVDIEKLQKKMVKELILAQNGHLKFPKLTAYPRKTLNGYVWVKDESFNVKDHIVMYDGEEPKNKKELEDVLGIIMSTPLPPNKAPWQFVLIQCNYKPDGS